MEPTKSVVASPLSAEFTLALAALGASGPIHNELLEGLGLPDDHAIRTSFVFLSTSLKSLKTLTLANKLYLQEGLEVLPMIKKYAELLNTEFGHVDFADSSKTTSTINDWVEKKTDGKIKEIYSSDGSEQETGLVLLNAIYFKGNWLHKLDPKDTRDEPFRVDSKKVITVPMMRYHQEEHFRHGWSKELQANILMLPYRESKSNMVIILPSEFDGLEDVFKKLAEGHDLLSDLRIMRKKKIPIAFPKFKIETTIDLTDVLKRLGMTAMFEGGITKILSKNLPLKVTKAVQKAFIDVNEEGTEAAAASMPMFVKVKGQLISFEATHPFAYILFGPGEVPLFVGAYRGDETASLSSIEEFTSRWC